MSTPSTHRWEQRLGTSVERKLLLVLLTAAIIPMIILLASVTTGTFQYAAIITTVVTQVVGLLIAYYVVSGIVGQASSINDTLVSITQGNFEARADAFTTDELGEAAVALNAMCDNTLNLIQSNEERDQIQTSIENLIAEMKAIAAGDLTITTDVTEDMTGSIAASVNHMTEQLRSIVQQVQSAAEQVTTSASRIRESSTTMSNDSDAQASRISKASEQLLEMTDAFQNVAALTQESVEVAVEARQTASNGLKAVSDTVDGMQRIRNQVQGTSKRIKRLSESSQEIGEIVQLISDIADRTSILALNASIQAAMAGDAGQGFAVVAEEIEGLAERSTDATKQIAKLIRAIQNETSEVISDMDESTREVVAGSHLATQAGETLFEIDSVSNQLVELIQASCTSALQQAETATKVASSMSEISQSTKESADKSREATRSVGLLADRIGQLRDSVSQFKIAAVVDPVDTTGKRPDRTATAASDAPATPTEWEAAAIDENRLRRLREVSNLLNKTKPSGRRDDLASDRMSSRVLQKPQESQGDVAKTIMLGASAEADERSEEVDDDVLRQLRDASNLLDRSNQADRAEVVSAEGATDRPSAEEARPSGLAPKTIILK